MYKAGYKKFIESRLMIVNKQSQVVPFKLNPIQDEYLQEGIGKDYILKARQQGFSSLILAIFTTDFILKSNNRSIVVADDADNASELLDRVKFYLQSYESITKIQIPLKYNSKYELVNQANHSRYTIGTAQNKEIGRSKTINNLHLSEFAFYPDQQKLSAGIMQGVVPDGRVIIETTANGYNYAKTYWEASVLAETGFKALFYKASDFYSPEFLLQKKRELGNKYPQEYPETPEEAFITSGETYFDKLAMKFYLDNAKEPINV